MAIKGYMNPNIPKPNPGTRSGKDGWVTKPMEPRKKRTGPPTPRGIVVPRRKRTSPLPPGTISDYAFGSAKKPFDLRKEKQLPRKITSVISKRKPAPKNKGGR